LCTNFTKKDALEIAGMFLHEFVHARIYEHLYHLGFNSNLRNFGLDKAWNDFVQLNFPFVQPVGNDQHKLMAQVFVNDIAMALWELNGKYGNSNDYLYIAWQGLQNAYLVEDRHKYDFIPDFEKLKTDFETSVQGKGRLKFNGCN
jgi:hypothetical protein